MRRKPLESLGAMVREHRGQQTLREAAATIGVGSATLLRVESGRVPDVSTFGKICHWLGVDPAVFLGSPTREVSARGVPLPQSTIEVSAHFRADQTPKPETMQALAQMLIHASRIQPHSPEPSPDEHP